MLIYRNQNYRSALIKEFVSFLPSFIIAACALISNVRAEGNYQTMERWSQTEEFALYI